MPGKIKIATDSNKVKRDLDVNQLSRIENSTEKGVDAERGVTFNFFENGKENRRSILFVSKRQRDAFVAEIEKLNPRLVQRKRDGTLTGRDEIASRRTGNKAEAERLAKAALAGGKDDDESAIGDGANERFFAMEENDFGFQEPRMVCFHEVKNEEMLQLIDATPGGAMNSDLMLRRLKVIAPHAVDKSVLSLIFHDGGLLKTVNRVVVLTFGSKAQRERFQKSLSMQLSHVDASVQKGIEIDNKWRSSLPTKTFFRFEAAMLFPKRAQVLLLINPKKRAVYVIRTAAIANYEPGCGVPSKTPVIEIISILPFRAQLQRAPNSDRVVSIGDASSSVDVDHRDYTTFEFSCLSERERFCAYVSLAASPDDALVIRDDPKRQGQLASIPTRAPVGCVRSTFRQPSSADYSSLWSVQWPHDDVKVWVGTYNVSGASPPESLEQWIVPPYKDAKDLYVFGVQEIGPASNREAWGKAFAAHLKMPTGNKIYPPGTAGDADLTYRLVDHVYMWEMGMWVFARSSHIPDITSVSHADLPTGVGVAKAITGVQLGNKGGIGCGLKWRETSLAFVMCHLAARPDAVRLKQRENDYKEIVRKLKLNTVDSHTKLDFTHSFDHVFFFGDLNYRIDLPFDRVVTLYKQKQWSGILAHDQLVRETAMRKVFVGFNEARIDFPPTYRWERDTEEFSWKRGQAPSYADRCLARSLPGVADKLQQLSYDSPTFMWGSDHRAVGASYKLGLRRYYSAPTSPMVYVPYPLPTFFTTFDTPSIPTPVVLLQNVRVFQMQALSAPAAIQLFLYAPWMEGGGPMPCGTVIASGITDKQKEALRALKSSLAEQAKVEAKKKIEEAKAAKAAAKLAKKEDTGPKVTLSGDPSYKPKSKVGGSGSFASSISQRKDEDDEDEDDGAGLNSQSASEYAILSEDAGYAATASQTTQFMDIVGADPKRKELFELMVSYEWLPSDEAFPPLRPVCWDPRLLRFSHLQILAHACPGVDGSMFAIGSETTKKGATKKPNLADLDATLVGQATLPLLNLVKGAQAAVEMAQKLDEELDDDYISKAKNSNNNSLKSPIGPSPLEAEIAASTSGFFETTSDTFVRAFNPLGSVPYALHPDFAPPVNFLMELELAGQPVGKISCSASLRASNDEDIKRRLAISMKDSPWSLPDTVFDANAVYNSIERAARERRALGFEQADGVASLLSGRDSFSEFPTGGGSFSSNISGGSEENASEIFKDLKQSKEATDDKFGVSKSSLSRMKKMDSFAVRAQPLKGDQRGNSNASYGDLISSPSSPDVAGGNSPSSSSLSQFAVAPPPPMQLSPQQSVSSGSPTSQTPPPPPDSWSRHHVIQDNWNAPPVNLPDRAVAPKREVKIPKLSSTAIAPPKKSLITVKPPKPGAAQAAALAAQAAAQAALAATGTAAEAAAKEAAITAQAVADREAAAEAEYLSSLTTQVDTSGDDLSGRESTALDSPNTQSQFGSGTRTPLSSSESFGVGVGGEGVVGAFSMNLPAKFTGPLPTKPKATTLSLSTAAGGASAAMQGANNMQVDERFAAFFEAQFAKKLGGGGSESVIPTAAAQSSNGVNIPRKATTIPVKKQPLVKTGSSGTLSIPNKKTLPTFQTGVYDTSSSSSSSISIEGGGDSDGGLGESATPDEFNTAAVSPSGSSTPPSGYSSVTFNSSNTPTSESINSSSSFGNANLPKKALAPPKKILPPPTSKAIETAEAKTAALMKQLQAAEAAAAEAAARHALEKEQWEAAKAIATTAAASNASSAAIADAEAAIEATRAEAEEAAAVARREAEVLRAQLDMARREAEAMKVAALETSMSSMSSSSLPQTAALPPPKKSLRPPPDAATVAAAAAAAAAAIEAARAADLAGAKAFVLQRQLEEAEAVARDASERLERERQEWEEFKAAAAEAALATDGQLNEEMLAMQADAEAALEESRAEAEAAARDAAHEFEQLQLSYEAVTREADELRAAAAVAAAADAAAAQQVQPIPSSLPTVIVLPPKKKAPDAAMIAAAQAASEAARAADIAGAKALILQRQLEEAEAMIVDAAARLADEQRQLVEARAAVYAAASSGTLTDELRQAQIDAEAAIEATKAEAEADIIFARQEAELLRSQLENARAEIAAAKPIIVPSDPIVIREVDKAAVAAAEAATNAAAEASRIAELAEAKMVSLMKQLQAAEAAAVEAAARHALEKEQWEAAKALAASTPPSSSSSSTSREESLRYASATFEASRIKSEAEGKKAQLVAAELRTQVNDAAKSVETVKLAAEKAAETVVSVIAQATSPEAKQAVSAAVSAIVEAKSASFTSNTSLSESSNTSKPSPFMLLKKVLPPVSKASSSSSTSNFGILPTKFALPPKKILTSTPSSSDSSKTLLLQSQASSFRQGEITRTESEEEHESAEAIVEEEHEDEHDHEIATGAIDEEDDFFGDDDEEEEEEEDNEEERALAAALEEARLKREAKAVKITSKAQAITSLLNAAIEKSRAATNQKVVAMWMPTSAADAIAKNIRSGVTSSFSSDFSKAQKHAYNPSAEFSGIKNLTKSTTSPTTTTSSSSSSTSTSKWKTLGNAVGAVGAFGGLPKVGSSSSSSSGGFGGLPKVGSSSSSSTGGFGGLPKVAVVSSTNKTKKEEPVQVPITPEPAQEPVPVPVPITPEPVPVPVIEQKNEPSIPIKAPISLPAKVLIPPKAVIPSATLPATVIPPAKVVAAPVTATVMMPTTLSTEPTSAPVVASVPLPAKMTIPPKVNIPSKATAPPVTPVVATEPVPEASVATSSPTPVALPPKMTIPPKVNIPSKAAPKG
jgi:hypothetical protein